MKQKFPDERVVGVQNKLIVLRRNLAFGWAGSALYARDVFRELNKALSESPSIEEMGRALMAYAALEPNAPVTLVGSIAVEGRFTNFQWVGETARLDFGAFFVAGTGTEQFERVAAPSDVSSTDTSDPLEAAIGWGLMRVGFLLGGEVLYGDNIKDHFGGGFDLVYFSNRFEHLSKVCQLFAVVDFTADNPRHFRFGLRNTTVWQQFNSGVRTERVDVNWKAAAKHILHGKIFKKVASKAAIFDQIDQGQPSPEQPEWLVVYTTLASGRSDVGAGVEVFRLPNTELRLSRNYGRLRFSMTKLRFDNLSAKIFEMRELPKMQRVLDMAATRRR